MLHLTPKEIMIRYNHTDDSPCGRSTKIYCTAMLYRWIERLSIFRDKKPESNVARIVNQQILDIELFLGV